MASGLSMSLYAFQPKIPLKTVPLQILPL